jgi:predicted enzyme related to lactoylglutathione lyase
MEEQSTMTVSISTIVFNSAHPKALADFYQKATGWKVTYSDDDFVYLGDGGSMQLGFQRADDYRTPTWPGPDTHMHLDLAVEDVANTEKQLIEAGATKPTEQPGEGKWTVLLDPEGHAFCIAPSS